MTEKSLNDCLNGKPSKKWPFVQPERPFERCQKNVTNLLNYINNHLNDFTRTLSRQGGSVRSER